VDYWRAGPDDQFVYDRRGPASVWHFDLGKIADEIERLEAADELPNRLFDGDYFLSFEIELLAWRFLWRRRERA
jgi:hypothetical protein